MHSKLTFTFKTITILDCAAWAYLAWKANTLHVYVHVYNLHWALAEQYGAGMFSLLHVFALIYVVNVLNKPLWGGTFSINYNEYAEINSLYTLYSILIIVSIECLAPLKF